MAACTGVSGQEHLGHLVTANIPELADVADLVAEEFRRSARSQWGLERLEPIHPIQLGGIIYDLLARGVIEVGPGVHHA